MSFENRRWIIIPTCFLNSVDFSSILENNPQTLRYSLDKSKTFIKYDDSKPKFISNITCLCPKCGCSENNWCMTGITELKHNEILSILSTTEWTDYSQV